MANVQILWVTRTMTVQGAVIKNHSHDYYHMLYVLSGWLDMTIAGKPFALRERECVLIPKSMEHGFTVSDVASAEYLEVKFALPDKGLDDQVACFGLRSSSNTVVGALVEQIVEEYAVLGHRADETAANYLQNQEQRYREQQEFRYIDASGYSPLSQEIIRYLEERFSRPLSLDELAREMGHSKSYLCSAFKKNTGTTILDCLNMIRIRRAAELLTYSDNNMAQVSAMCGFASPNNFNRVFLKYVGVTPGQCRRAFPADILLHDQKENIQYPNRLIYSVLAQKQIPLDVYLADLGMEQ